jgi:hypothetical protein
VSLRGGPPKRQLSQLGIAESLRGVDEVLISRNTPGLPQTIGLDTRGIADGGMRGRRFKYEKQKKKKSAGQLFHFN